MIVMDHTSQFITHCEIYGLGWAFKYVAYTSFKKVNLKFIYFQSDDNTHNNEYLIALNYYN